MKDKIKKKIRFFKVIRTMDKKKLFRKLKIMRQYRKKNRMVKEILGNMLIFEILGLTAVLEQHSAMEESKKQVSIIQEMMIGYHNMANNIQQQSNNLNCQIENLAYRMEQFQVNSR